ncbi:hypothetical protein F7230_08135 [Corynebacterium sp. 320]|uniref:hypothetical protein n=1 Tax=Corynebacterium TaxID=1716 RepID=UPI00125CD3C3|nr:MULTISPECIES: hypothetical protein [Corynebacterium]KAB1502403.1 hypothetical protein F7230_08135 [Corynebacterium sp. 320]KAB1551375.1 hypothetical protein F7233_07640 [Corynebacterium sp. 321]KAB1551796.1 hypothetical protein F7232_06630 [Corynebacterium sp. 319]KAB3526010.1 hypothetical protein F8354_08135 [Corynebacterium sp. 250]KAB3538791.1 hypothetical protein F8390_07210 [Corynebacterium sp. 366]
MANKKIFLVGVCTLIAAFAFILFGQRVAAIVLLISAAADFTLVFWTQKDGAYYQGKYANGHRWVDTVSVWAGALFIAITDNWVGLTLFIFPLSLLWSESHKKE